MSDIDWSRAPKEAEAFHPESIEQMACWYKRCDSGYVWCSLAEGAHLDIWTYMGGRKDYPVGAVMRPAAEKAPAKWTGDGLPPVGVEVEWHECQQTGWQRVTVLAYHGDEAWIAPAGKPSIVVGNPANFRPIRTPEQIAEEERKAAIEDMADVIKTIYQNDFVCKRIAEQIYKAGYRKAGDA